LRSHKGDPAYVRVNAETGILVVEGAKCDEEIATFRVQT